MTVCVAAICENGAVMGASDRMLTAGDVQFEPQQSKIRQMTTSIAVMIAGDSAMQEDIVQRVYADVRERIRTDPTNWWLVRDVADLYRKYCIEARLKRAETAILSPLGLTHETYLARQGELSDTFVRQLATELINYEAPRVAAIIAGIDPTGVHLYVAQNSEITCHDGVGFAAIGAGYWHADSQMMFAGHTRQRAFPETLLLAYSAKKRAEVAPCVGVGTDMFFVGELGAYVSVGEHVLEKLEEIYQTTLLEQQDIEARARVSVTQYVEEINAASTAKEQATKPTEDGGGTAPLDEKAAGPVTETAGAAEVANNGGGG